MRTCFLFPGQGAQYPGMGKDLWDSCEKVRDLFGEASEVTGMDLQRLLFEGSEEELKATDKTQVAVTLVNLSASLVLQEMGVEPQGCAGFSLGEYSALWQAGVLENRDLFAIVKARGQLMETASRSADAAEGDSGPSGMMAVLGLGLEDARKVLEELQGEGAKIYLANQSSPIQVVLAGTQRGLQRAQELFEKAGAARVVPLKVSGPFHSPLLDQASRGLREVLRGYRFADPRLPVYANVTGKAIGSGEEARELCVRQVVSTVLWVEEEENILKDGYERLLEVGPGSVLGGLWKSFNKKIRVQPAGKLEDIERVLQGG